MKKKSACLFFDLYTFNLENFRINLISLFNDNSVYDFQLGVIYYIYLFDSNSKTIGIQIPFKLLSLDDKDKLIEKLYNEICKITNNSNWDLGKYFIDLWGEKRYMKFLIVYIGY